MEGSVIDVIEDSAIASNWEIQKMKYNRDVKKAGYTASATKSRFVGQSAYWAGKMNAAGTLLTGGMDTYKYGEEQGYF